MALSGGVKKIDQAVVSLVDLEYKDRLKEVAGIAVFAPALRRSRLGGGRAGADVHAFDVAMDR